jgi:hypothetical protein
MSYPHTIVAAHPVQRTDDRRRSVLAGEPHAGFACGTSSDSAQLSIRRGPLELKHKIPSRKARQLPRLRRPRPWNEQLDIGGWAGVRGTWLRRLSGCWSSARRPGLVVATTWVKLKPAERQLQVSPDPSVGCSNWHRRGVQPLVAHSCGCGRGLVVLEAAAVLAIQSQAGTQGAQPSGFVRCPLFV